MPLTPHQQMFQLTETTATKILNDLHLLHHRTPRAIHAKLIEHLMTYAQTLATTFVDDAPKCAEPTIPIPDSFRGNPKHPPIKTSP